MKGLVMLRSELVQMEEDICFHWRQMCDSVWLLRENVNERKDLERGEWSAWIDSFAINARVLIDFLYKPRKREEDVRATDYLQNKSAWPSKTPPALASIFDKASKEIAHITRKRLQVSAGWELCGVVQSIHDELLRFRKAMLSER